MADNTDNVLNDHPFVTDIMKRGKECPFRGGFTSNPICIKEECALYVSTQCCFWHMGQYRAML